MTTKVERADRYIVLELKLERAAALYGKGQPSLNGKLVPRTFPTSDGVLTVVGVVAGREFNRRGEATTVAERHCATTSNPVAVVRVMDILQSRSVTDHTVVDPSLEPDMVEHDYADLPDAKERGEGVAP